jgi:hypothetical protein
VADVADADNVLADSEKELQEFAFAPAAAETLRTGTRAGE